MWVFINDMLMSSLRRIRLFPVYLLICLTAACGRDSADSSAVDTGPLEEVPDQESSPFELTMTSKGTRSAEVASGYMSYYIERGTYYLSDSVMADFYDEYGNHTSRLTSLRATINEKENLMFAQNNVVVISDSGATLFTEELYWNKETDTIYTKDNVAVTIVTETDTLYGRGLQSDRSLKNYEIKQPTGVSHRITRDQK